MRKLNYRFPRGTSLIEVILVMTIISILISMAELPLHAGISTSLIAVLFHRTLTFIFPSMCGREAPF